MMHGCFSYWHVTHREHREIFQTGGLNTPSGAPPVAPPSAPPSGLNVPPNNPNAAKAAAKNRILQAQAAGQKVQTMKQSMDIVIADIKNLHTPPAAPPAGAPAAPDALTAAKSSVDAIKSATNINTLPADPLNTMLANARLLGPEAVIVCDKIDEAMIAADTAITNEADPTKKADITAMKATLETNAKLVLADLLTPDVKTGAPKAAASFLGPLDPTVAKDIEAAANGETALLSAINDPNATEANRSKAIGQMMSKYGVTVEKNNAGNYVPVAPASSLVKFLNQVSGLFMMLGLGNFMQQKKSTSTPSGTPPNAPSNGPSTTLNQTEQDEIKKNIKDPSIGMAREKIKATAAKTAAEMALYGAAVAPNTPLPAPLPSSLKGQLVTLNGEKTQLETDITNLKNATPPDPARITAKTGELNVKISQITAKEAEIKAQEDVVKKEEVKIKYIDDLTKAATDSVTALKEVQTYITTFNTKRTYKNADSQIVHDAVAGMQVDGPGDDLNIRCLNVDLSKWQAMQNLAAQKFGIVKTDMDLTAPNIMKDPEKCLAALKVMKEKFADHEKKIDSRIGALTTDGASNVEAADVAKIEMNVPGMQFEFKSGQWAFASEPGERAYDAYMKSSEQNVSNLLKNYMNTKIQADPLSSPGQSFLDKALSDESIDPTSNAIQQYKKLIKEIPLLKQNVTVSTPMVKVADVTGLKEEIERHPLFKGNTLDAELRTYMGM